MLKIEYAQEQDKPVHAIVSSSDGITDCGNISAIQWFKTSDRFPTPDPKHPDNDVLCLVVRCGYSDVQILAYNPYHKCWDDETMDDFYCKLDEVYCWALLPTLPQNMEQP